MKDAFSRCHPAVNFIYFFLVIGSSMLLFHPVCLGVGFFCSLSCAWMLTGKKLIRTLGGLSVMMVLAAALNPLFNHEGATVLGYFSSGNPLTLESIWSGAASAIMLGTVVLWFSCYHAVMTSDKFVYLFGRIIPAFSMVLSAVLRFIPCFMRQLGRVQQSQRHMEGKNTAARIGSGIRQGLRQVSMMITWSLEHAVDTGDSMRARGYGLPGRTAFIRYRLSSRDWFLLGAEAAGGLFLMLGAILGKLRFHFYPVMRMADMTAFSLALFVVYALICLIPVFTAVTEEIQWRQSRSKI